MNIIDKIKKKKSNLNDLIDVRKVSKTLKFFQAEIIELEKSNFTRTEQRNVFEKLLGIEIPYQTYNSFFVRNIKSKNKRSSENDLKQEDDKTSSEKKDDDIDTLSKKDEVPKKDNDSIAKKPVGIKINIDTNSTNDYELKKADKSKFI